MNVGTYSFQIVSARLLGPEPYGALASMMALLLVLGVAQLGLQATGARRIAAEPENVHTIEAAVLRTGWRTAAVLCVVATAASPLVWKVLHLDSIVPALLLGLTVLPTTVFGAQAGVLQGERRWLALSVAYVAAGLPRVLTGTAFLLVSASETSAMLGVFVASWLPVLVAHWVLGRHQRKHPVSSTSSVQRDVLRETAGSSLALLAMFALSSLDVVVARNVLVQHDAGLYAGGLIVTKAVLFLPQFAVVVLFPSMSTDNESKGAVVKGLAVVGGLGAAAVAATYLLSGVALIFIGGAQYSAVQDNLWLFAVLGAMLSLLQLLVYAGLARRGVATKYIVGAGVVAMVALGSTAASLVGLATRVAVVDFAVLVVLLALQSVRHRRPVADPLS